MDFRFVIQARLKSKRLPKKCFAKIGNKPLLGRLVERIVQIAPTEKITLAIPHGDKLLKQWAEQENISVIEGDEYNVYSRFRKAALTYPEPWIFRLTGDNPFPAIEGLQDLMQLAKTENPDYAFTAGYPLGMGSELIKRDLFLQHTGENFQPFEKEHVTVFFRMNKNFIQKTVSANIPACSIKLRLTVDEMADLKTARLVYEKLHDHNPFFTAKDVVLLSQKHPEIFLQNKHVVQKSETSYEQTSHTSTTIESQ